MSRANLNSVKLAVQQAILDTPRFTVADIAKRTGFRLDSIQTQVQRMKKQGIVDVDSASKEDLAASNKRGAPPVTYRLTQDVEKLRALREDILSFYSHLRERTPRPTSKHFTLAKQAIDMALRCEDSKKEELLQEAELQLEIVRDTECDAEADENLKAHIEFENARVKYARQKYKETTLEFAHLRTVFLQHRDEEALRSADEYWLDSKIDSFLSDAAHVPRPADLIEHVLEIISDVQKTAHHSLCTTMVKLLKMLQSSIVQASQIGALDLCTLSSRQHAHLYHYLPTSDCEGVIGHLDMPETFLHRIRGLPPPLRRETFQEPVFTLPEPTVQKFSDEYSHHQRTTTHHAQ